MGASNGRSAGAPGGRRGGLGVASGNGGAGSARRAGGAAGGSAHRALVSALTTIADDDRVARAQEAVREASAELRWHEALRRRWREARAEAAIRGAIASGAIEGALVSAPELRERVAAGGLDRPLSGDPSLDAVAGIWRAGARLAGFMADLRGQSRPAEPSPRSLLTSLHRDIAGPLAASGAIGLDEVAVPRTALPGGTPSSGGTGSAGEPEALGAAPREGGPGPAPQGQALAERAGRIHALRAAAAERLMRDAGAELAALAMPNARLLLELEPLPEPGPYGADQVRLLFSANPGQSPAPLSRVASGGELSRVRLALEVVLAGGEEGHTFVFDEVDAGIGGQVALEVGRRLKRLAAHAQVIVVTHLAQVAAFADSHLVVTKSTDGRVTSSDVRRVEGAEREAEIARLMAGTASEVALRHARELLARAAEG